MLHNGKSATTGPPTTEGLLVANAHQISDLTAQTTIGTARNRRDSPALDGALSFTDRHTPCPRGGHGTPSPGSAEWQKADRLIAGRRSQFWGDLVQTVCLFA